MGMERWTGSHLRTWSPFRDSSIDGYDGSRWIERFLLWNFIQWAAEVGEIRIEAWVVLVRLGGLKIITDSKKNGKCKFSTGFYFRFTFAPLCLFFFFVFLLHILPRLILHSSRSLKKKNINDPLLLLTAKRSLFARRLTITVDSQNLKCKLNRFG